MFPVTDVMSKNVLAVSKEMPAIQLAKLLVDKHITGVPVVDKDNVVVGVISEFDVLRLLVESDKSKQLTVGDLMSKKAICFEDTASATDVCEFFLTNPSKRRVPITTSDGKLVGLVSRADIVKFIVKLRNA